MLSFTLFIESSLPLHIYTPYSPKPSPSHPNNGESQLRSRSANVCLLVVNALLNRLEFLDAPQIGIRPFVVAQL